MISKEVVNELSKEYSSFYVANIDKFEENYKKLKESFAKYWNNFNIAYSYKTNYLPDFCMTVNKLGGFAEVVSEMELELALRLGVPYEKIIWNGPIKRRDTLKTFIQNGGHVNVDNVDEFDYLVKLIQNGELSNVNFGLRVNFDVGDNVVSRFGVDYPSENFNYILKKVSCITGLKLEGLHCHFAKRSIEYWPQRAKGMIEIIKKEHLDLYYIDLGGGMFGEFDSEFGKQLNVRPTKYIEYASIVLKEFNEHFNGNNKPLLLIEPGTAIVANCMCYLAAISSIKTIKNKTFITVCGSQKNISMQGINPPIDVYSFSKNKIRVKNADIVGYTCIEGDVLYKDFSGDVGKNDYLSFGNCGSYSIVMKPPFIFPNCPIFTINNEKVRMVKREESFGDIFLTYNCFGDLNE